MRPTRPTPTMPALAVLSLHTSPLVLPGQGDSGGMNVYVRELAGSLAQAGVDTTVYVRRDSREAPEVVEVESGLRVVSVAAGPVGMAKEDLHGIVDEFTAGVRDHIVASGGMVAVHANYWLSGLAGHRLKHDLCLPLVTTFHTLARVKAEGGDAESERRAQAEAEIIGCADTIVASCRAEADQLVEHYGARADRIEVVPPGVDHAFFSPGDRRAARAALGLGDHPVLLFVGRVQPLKGLTVAVEALAELGHPEAQLVVVGGASGPEGPAEMARARALVESCRLSGRVRFVDPQPHHLLSTYYRAADVCLVPSRSESFGLVALEAAACGTPVVAAAVGGLTSLVDDGVTGLLIEGRQPGDYAAAVRKILDDPSLAAYLAHRASERAQAYTWSTTAARLRRVYADLSARALVRCV